MPAIGVSQKEEGKGASALQPNSVSQRQHKARAQARRGRGRGRHNPALQASFTAKPSPKVCLLIPMPSQESELLEASRCNLFAAVTVTQKVTETSQNAIKLFTDDESWLRNQHPLSSVHMATGNGHLRGSMQQLVAAGACQMRRIFKYANVRICLV